MKQRAEFHATILRSGFLCIAALAGGGLVSCDIFDSKESSSGSSHVQIQLTPGQTEDVAMPRSSGTSDTVEFFFMAESGSTYSIEMTGDAGVQYTISVQSKNWRQLHLRNAANTLDSFVIPSLGSDTFRIFLFGLPNSKAQAKLDVTAGLPWWVPGLDSFDIGSTPATSLDRARTIVANAGWQNHSLSYPPGTLQIDHSKPPPQDWFSLHIDSGATYAIVSQGYASGLTPEIEVRDEDSCLVPISETHRSQAESWQTDTIRFQAVRATKYFVRASSWTAMGYRIQVQFKPGVDSNAMPDASEPDNTMATAQALPIDGIWRSHSFYSSPRSRSDTDWFSLHVDSGRTYSLSYVPTGFTPPYLSVTAQLFTSDSLSYSMESSRNSSSSPGETFKFSSIRTGTMYLRMEGPTTSGYRISATGIDGISSTGIRDEFEPDDNLSQAKTMVDDGIWHHLSLEPVRRPGYAETGGPDNIAFQADSGRTYRFRLTGFSQLIETSILTQDSSIVQAMDSTVADTVFVIVPSLKTQKLVLHLGSPVTTRYSLSLESVAGIPGWVASRASLTSRSPDSMFVLQPDSITYPQYSFVGDTNWIKIPVSAGQTCHVRVTNLADGREIYFSAGMQPKAVAFGSNSYAYNRTSGETEFTSSQSGFVYLWLSTDSFLYGSTYVTPYTIQAWVNR